MSESTFSWVRAYEEGTLTELQMETLQAAMDTGEAESLLEAARQLDFEVTHNVGGEPGPIAY